MKTLYYMQHIVGTIHDSTIYASETKCPYFTIPTILIGSKGCQMCQYHEGINFNKQTVQCTYEEKNDHDL